METIAKIRDRRLPGELDWNENTHTGRFTLKRSSLEPGFEPEVGERVAVPVGGLLASEL